MLSCSLNLISRFWVVCFSPDGRLGVVQDASKVLGLVEIATGRTLARLESPDLHSMKSATFSPDGSRSS